MKNYLIAGLLAFPAVMQAQGTSGSPTPPTPQPVVISTDIVLNVGLQSCTFSAKTPRSQLMRGFAQCLDKNAVVTNPASPSPSGRGRGRGPVSRATVGAPQSPRIVTGRVFLRAEVDKPVEFLTGDQPSEATLHGMTGKVIAQFIVEPTGRVDSTSIRIMASPDVELSVVATNMIKTFTFKPAISQGRRVRQEVEQTVTFVQ
jgi:TonB family protein